MGHYLCSIHVEFVGARQGFLHNPFQFRDVNQMVLNEKDNVVNVGIKAAV